MPLLFQENPTIGHRRRLSDRSIYLLLTLALTVFVVAPLAYPGTLQVHSGFVPLYNLGDLAASPDPLRWLPHIATAFEPLRGDGLLGYYLVLPLVRLGATPMTAVKAVLALGWILGALGMYLWQRPSLGHVGACLSALVYTYAPYRIAAAYVRGDWGEALALGLLPFGAMALLGGVWPGRIGPRALLAGVAWAVIALSQPGLALLAWLCLLLWRLVEGPSRRDLGTLAAGGAGLGIGCVVSVGAAGWRLGTSPVIFADHYLVPAQLLSAFWGFGASRAGWNDGLALGLGLAPVGLALLTLLLALQRARAGAPPLRLRGPVTVALVGCALLFAPSEVIWRSGLNTLVTYPWQMVGLIGLCLAPIAGAAARLSRRLTTLPALVGLTAITLVASYGFLQPRFTQFEPGGAPYATFNDFTILVLDVRREVEIPPTAAGLPLPTPGRLPLSDYGPLRPGDTLRLVITWQALQALDRDYKLFVHVLDPSGAVIAQADPILGAGADPDRPGDDYFASQWDPGRLVVTDVPVTLPMVTAPGEYHIAFGLYDGDTLERLPVDGLTGGAVSGGTIQVGVPMSACTPTMHENGRGRPSWGSALPGPLLATRCLQSVVFTGAVC